MKHIVTLTSLIIFQTTFCQLTTLKKWSGDTANFIFTGNHIRLNDTNKIGKSSLFTPSQASINAVWEITSRLEFNPSINNGINYILTSDATDTENYNGYFLHIGKNGSDDALELWRQEGTESYLLNTGTLGRFGTELDSFKIKVARDSSYLWDVKTDLFNGNGLETEFKMSDSTFRTSQYFGFSAHYTTTRSDKYSFNNIHISGNSLLDTVKPYVINSRIMTDSSILVSFSENVIINTNILAHVDHKAHINVTTASRDELLFTFSSFPTNELFLFSLEQVLDLHGNYSEKYEKEFSLFKPQLYDVVITEVYPQPSEESNLPNAEYIEIYNNSGTELNLKNWYLKDLTSNIRLPEITLKQDSILVFAESKNELLFTGINNVFFIESLPSLNNSGDIITILDPMKNEIHGFSYQKKLIEEGKSIELSDIKRPCLTKHLLIPGGSPGTKFNGNSKTIDYSLQILTSLDSVEIISTIPLELSHDLSISINGRNTQTIHETQENTITISPKNPLELNLENLMEIENLRFCDGHEIDTSTSFVFTEVAKENELLITEVLFNPLTDISEYIEIYNNTEDKIFRLNDIILQTLKLDEIKNNTAFTTPLLLHPHQYYIICNDKTSILKNYEAEENRIIETNLPILHNDDGVLQLISKDSILLDCVKYNTDWHSKLFTTTEKKGKSLERINLNKSGKDKYNWFSSSSENNYGSPTYENSAQSKITSSTTELSLTRENVSPDGDGFEDFTFLSYSQLPNGTLINVTLFNSSGQKLNKLIQNEVLNESGNVLLDLSHDGFNPSMGIHVLRVELNYPDGKQEQKKLAITVNKKF